MLKSRFGVYGRLLSLSILVACLFFVAQHRTLADTEYVCDTNYSGCYVDSSGDPTGSCLDALHTCMQGHVRNFFFSGPICDPSGAGMNTTCLHGNIHMWDSSYSDLSGYFEACMQNSAPEANSKDCCEYTANYYLTMYCP
jgi:hypothetical protein